MAIMQPFTPQCQFGGESLGTFLGVDFLQGHVYAADEAKASWKA